MQYFGDESGHFPSMIDGNESVFSVAVVCGNPENVGRCSRRAVRDIRPLSEAKWADMQQLQKRRYCDCVTENADSIKGAFARITPSDIRSLKQGYRLYNALDLFDIRADEIVIGSLYAALLRELEAEFQSRATFTFDKYLEGTPSENIVSVITHFVDIDVEYEQSTRKKSIQTADCVAGASTEDVKHDTGWIASMAPVIKDASDHGYWMLEEVLKEYSTGP